MDLNSFETLFRSEHRARQFFVKSCGKNYRRFCIRCHGDKLYRIAGNGSAAHAVGIRSMTSGDAGLTTCGLPLSIGCGSSNALNGNCLPERLLPR